MNTRALLAVIIAAVIGAFGVLAQSASASTPTYLTGAPKSVASGAARSCNSEARRLGPKRFAQRYPKRNMTARTPMGRCRAYQRPRVYGRWLTAQAASRCRALPAPVLVFAYRGSVRSCRSRAVSQVAASRRAQALLAAAKQAPSRGRVASCLSQAVSSPADYDNAWQLPARSKAADAPRYDVATDAAWRCQANDPPAQPTDGAADDASADDGQDAEVPSEADTSGATDDSSPGSRDGCTVDPDLCATPTESAPAPSGDNASEPTTDYPPVPDRDGPPVIGYETSAPTALGGV